MFPYFTVRRRNIGIRVIENKILLKDRFKLFKIKNTMKKLALLLIGAILLTSCKVSKPTEKTPKGFFFKMKHKKSDEK